jgi:ribosome biogenesis GTPase A
MDTEKIDERIIQGYDNVSEDIDNILDEFNTLRSEKLFVKTLGADSVQKVKDNCTLIKRRLNDAFNIVVIGDFKRGKSTLINALIGEDIVPTAVAPETVTINKISFSETPKAEAVLKNGKRATLSYNELSRQAIEKITEQLPSEIDFIDIKANVDILKEITIVDTPGLGDLLENLDDKVADYLVNADALIYMVSARAPLSMTERTFLSSVVMPQSFSRVFAVLNMADTLETAENIDKIRESTGEKASEISPNIYVYIISALDELCRRKQLKRPEPELASLLENNFLEFETALNNDIILQKDIVKSMRAVALTQSLIDDTANRIKLVKNSLALNVEKLMSNEEEFKNENSALMKEIENKKIALANDIDEMKREAKNWIAEFLTRLKDEISGIQNTVNVTDLEKHFQFFMSDMIKNAFISCMERHQKDISDRISDMAKSTSSEIIKNAFGTVDAQITGSIADISWTKADTVMLFGDFLNKTEFGLGLGLFYIAGQAIAGFIRQGTMKKKQTDFLEPVLQGFDSITNDVINNTNTVYEKLKLAAVDKLRETFQKQIDTSLGAIDQAKQITQDESVKKEEVAEYLDSVLADLERHKDVLGKYS